MKKFLVKIYEKTKLATRKIKRHLITPPTPQNSDGKVYVNLGCGNNSGPEFINVDVLSLPNIHHVHDITKLEMFATESVDLIYASHVVEHLPPEKFISTIKEWRRVLKIGGRLRISVPDFDRLIEVYQGNGGDVKIVRDQVLGQRPPYDNHYTLWNQRYAEDQFTALGFVALKSWDPLTADHHNFKDRSSRTIKVAGKEVAISLNLEMVKSD